MDKTQFYSGGNFRIHEILSREKIMSEKETWSEYFKQQNWKYIIFIVIVFLAYLGLVFIRGPILGSTMFDIVAGYIVYLMYKHFTKPKDIQK